MVIPALVSAWRNCWQVMHTIKDRLGRSWPGCMAGQRVESVASIGTLSVRLYYSPFAAFVNCFCGHNQGMTDPSPTLQFDLDANAIRLLHRSLSFYLEKWPGGPDPREQEDLQRLRTLFYAALLECSFHEDGQR